MADQTGSLHSPSRAVLEGVPKVGFYDGARCPEDIIFPSCVRAFLEYVGDGCGCKYAPAPDVKWQCGCTYAFLVGVTGAAFHLSWKPGWHRDNGDIRHMSDDPAAPFERGLQATRYAYEILGKGQGTEDLFRRRIVESIRDRGRPVLAFGVVGPPECCIIAGYDEGGDVLVGWSFFQGFPEFADALEFEPSGYFRKRDWFGDTEGLVLIGDRGERPPLRETYRQALEWGIQVIRTPVTRGDRHNGLAAYAVWVDHLLMDEEFHGSDIGTLWQRFTAHDDAVSVVAEARWYGSLFLAQAAADGGDWDMSEDLYHAAACFAAEHALMWQVWDQVGGIGHSEEKVLKLAEPGVRRAIVPIIREAQEKDRAACEHIERALSR
jgi:hypothetical protein